MKRIMRYVGMDVHAEIFLSFSPRRPSAGGYHISLKCARTERTEQADSTAPRK